MSNRNEYNYYKNEYGKYKANYYSPGSEEYKKRQSGSRKQKAARILRAFVVFVIIAAIVVGIVFGIIKLSAVINDRIGSKETTTVPTTEVTTLPKKEESNDNKFKKGTKCIVKTEEGTGVNLRSKPTYDVAGYQLVVDGETVIIDEISEDGKWCKTSNFDKDGWLNLKYLQIVTEENTTKNTEETTTEKATEKPTEKPTEKETTTEKPTEKPTEGKTQTDNSIKTYADAVKAFKEKGNGAVMNCKIVGSGSVYAVSAPSESAVKILVLFPGESIRVVAVDGEYSKIVKTGYESAVTWVPNANLSFVSWG